MIYAVTLDWLQVFALGEFLSTDVIRFKDTKYTAKLTDKQSMQWKRIYYIYQGRFKVAEICQEPRTSVINPKATTIKIENRILYTTQYTTILYDILKVYNLHYKGVTRIDVALDCQELAQGLQIQDFLRRCIALDENEKGYIYNVGRAHSTFHMCRDAAGHNTINSVKWGSPRSRVSCYCYDKTLELIEVKDKPWIRNFWERNGLDWQIAFDELDELTTSQRKRMVERMSLKDYVKKPVYRFEISIKGQGKEVVIGDTGEILNLDIEYLQNQIQVQALFFSYAKSCFKFRENTGQSDRYNFHPLQIFDVCTETPFKPYAISESKESGRSERVLYNKLYRMMQELPEDDTELRPKFEDVMEHVKHQAEINLWFMQRRQEVDDKLTRKIRQKRELTYALYCAETNQLSLLEDEVAELQFNYLQTLQGNEIVKYELLESDPAYWISLAQYTSLLSANAIPKDSTPDRP